MTAALDKELRTFIRNPETERYDLTHCIFIKIVIPGKEIAAAVV